MNQSKLLIGVGVGAAIAYMLDPNRGRRRRALVADQVRRASGKTRDAIDATMRDMTNRAVGIAAATRARLAHDDVDDATLIERVRATLGRVCSHPRAIDVEVDDGNVTLRGPLLKSELDTVLGGVAAVRGVRSVNNELEQHVSAEGVPSLQGSSNVAGPTLDVFAAELGTRHAGAGCSGRTCRDRRLYRRICSTIVRSGGSSRLGAPAEGCGMSIDR